MNKKGFIHWFQVTESDSPTYMVVVAVSPKQASYFFYNYLKNVVGRYYDASYRPTDEMTLPFETFACGEIWALEGLLRNYAYESRKN